MNGVTIRYELPIDQLTERLRKLAEFTVDDLKTDIGEYMIGQIQDRFDHQQLWAGTAMPQSKAARARGGQTLIDHRLLYKSYVYNKTSEGLEIGSASQYARIHHFGGETGRQGHRFIMMARPVLGINNQDERHIGDLILNELRGIA